MGIRKILLLSCIIIMLHSTVYAYTEQKGVSQGDTVNLDYELHVDGVQEDKGNIPNALISPDGGFVEGFWKGVIGAKLKTYKSFSVPPDQGYTQPGSKFYGKTLDFTIYVNNVTNSVDSTDVTSTAPGLALDFNFIPLLFGLVILSSYKLRIKSTNSRY